MARLLGLTALTVFCLLVCSHAADITTVAQLQQAIIDGPNRKVGFISDANYQSVRSILPALADGKGNGKTELVICDNEEHYGVKCDGVEELTSLVKDGKIAAAIISGLPNPAVASSIHSFSSALISQRAMLMVPELSAEHPRGFTGANSTRDLSLALNAAIASVQALSLDVAAATANFPYKLTSVRSCQTGDLGAYSVPNKKEATGLLKQVLETRTLKIGSLGPSNYGPGDGNYLKDPPVGFYPELLTLICTEFGKLKGPDGEAYGEISCTREYHLKSNQVFADLFNGKVHATEPYYVLDADYVGTNESCVTDANCPPADLSGGHEKCVAGFCAYTPARPRLSIFRPSCTTLGVDATVMTQRGPTDAEKLVWWLVMIIIFGSLGLLAALCAICFMVYKERTGKGVFQPLSQGDTAATEPINMTPV